MKKNYYPAILRFLAQIRQTKRGLLFFTVFTLVHFAAMSQTATELVLKGTVTDETKQPLEGVTVSLKGTPTKTQTNEKGVYMMHVPGASGTLVFSFTGKQTTEVVLNGNTNIDVVLRGDVLSLEEVIAIGYGVAKKKDLSGSISAINGEEVAKRNVTQVSQALQGAMPGVMVTRSSSMPGAAGTILVRGVTTIGNSAPLVIVDGVPVNSIDDVNADDIQDISVLKDAASASIYGARAAAGVIVITTKRPKTGQLSLEYTTNTGIEKPTRRPEVVGVRRYLEMMNEFTWNDAGNNPGGDYALYTQDAVENWLTYNKTQPNKYPVTDWNALLINKSAPRQSHYLRLSAGTDKIKTQASLNYEKIKAMYDRSSYERVMSRVNNTFTINKYLSANIDFAYNYSLSENPTVNPVWDALRYAPIYAATWADGRIAEGKNGVNTYAELHHGGFNNTWANQFMGRVALHFEPLTGLQFSGVFAPNFSSTKNKRFIKEIRFYAADDPTLLAGHIGGHQTTNLYESRGDAKTFTKQLLANYRKKLHKHNFNMLAGYEDYYSFDESLRAQATNYVLSNFPYLDLASIDFMQNGGLAIETAYQSYFGRLLYDYGNKYFLQANIRYDGSSRFHRDYRWGSFPSVSVGWAISQESFMKNSRLFSHLKLRAAWGQLGNERIGNYPYQSSISYSNSFFYQGNSPVSALTAAQVAYAIRDISWETTETVNVGLDAYFLNNRLSVTADVYRKTTKDMLLELEIPDYMGFDNPQQNTGKMFTNGWDLQLGWKDRIGNVKYSVVLNASDSRSKMGYLGGIVLDGSQIIRQGSEYMEWYGYVADGIFQTQEEVNHSPKLFQSVKPGDIKYRDISGPGGIPDGIVSPEYDRVLLGGSLPRYLYSGTINADYKGFDLSVVFQGVGKQKSRLTPEMVKPFFTGWTNAPAIIDGHYWSVYNSAAQNASARFPRLSFQAGEANNYENSSFWMISGAYLRLKFISLGYTLPQRITEKAKINNVRFFVSATDLLARSRFPKGWDPEAIHNTYITSVFDFGVSIKF